MESKFHEIRKAIEENMPQAALALTLTLPDICAQVEYPDEKSVGKRYVDWLKKNIPREAFDVDYEGLLTRINGNIDPQLPVLTPEAIYKLRCHFLHSGDSDIVKEKGVDNMDYFVLKKIGAGDFKVDGYGVESRFEVFTEKNQDGTKIKHYQIDVDYLCNVILCAAEKKNVPVTSNRECIEYDGGSS